MTGQCSTTSTAACLMLAERAAGYALASMTDVTDAHLSLPTPCQGWDVRRLLLHVEDAAALLEGMVTTGEGRPVAEPAGAEAARRPVDDAALAIGRLLQTLAHAAERHPDLAHEPGAGPLHEAACGTAIELTAHTGDLVVALDPSAEVPHRLASDVLDLATSLISDDTRGPHFGPRLDVPPAASAHQRLFGFLGRSSAGEAQQIRQD